jgi:hypothetical protein
MAGSGQRLCLAPTGELQRVLKSLGIACNQVGLVEPVDDPARVSIVGMVERADIVKQTLAGEQALFHAIEQRPECDRPGHAVARLCRAELPRVGFPGDLDQPLANPWIIGLALEIGFAAAFAHRLHFAGCLMPGGRQHIGKPAQRGLPALGLVEDPLEALDLGLRERPKASSERRVECGAGHPTVLFATSLRSTPISRAKAWMPRIAASSVCQPLKVWLTAMPIMVGLWGRPSQ